MNKLLLGLLLVGLGFLLIRYARARPQDFSAASVVRSLWVLGIIALFLIALLGTMVSIIRLT